MSAAYLAQGCGGDKPSGDDNGKSTLDHLHSPPLTVDIPTDSERLTVSNRRDAFVSLPRSLPCPALSLTLHSNPLEEAGWVISGAPLYVVVSVPRTPVAASPKSVPPPCVSIAYALTLHDQIFSVGRGGAGNLHFPSRDALRDAALAEAEYEAKVVREHAEATTIVSTPRSKHTCSI